MRERERCCHVYIVCIYLRVITFVHRARLNLGDKENLTDKQSSK